MAVALVLLLWPGLAARTHVKSSIFIRYIDTSSIEYAVMLSLVK